MLKFQGLLFCRFGVFKVTKADYQIFFPLHSCSNILVLPQLPGKIMLLRNRTEEWYVKGCAKREKHINRLSNVMPVPPTSLSAFQGNFVGRWTKLFFRGNIVINRKSDIGNYWYLQSGLWLLSVQCWTDIKAGFGAFAPSAKEPGPFLLLPFLRIIFFFISFNRY